MKQKRIIEFGTRNGIVSTLRVSKHQYNLWLAGRHPYQAVMWKCDNCASWNGDLFEYAKCYNCQGSKPPFGGYPVKSVNIGNTIEIVPVIPSKDGKRVDDAGSVAPSGSTVRETPPVSKPVSVG